MSSEVQIALIGLAGTVFTGFMAYMTLKIRSVGRLVTTTHKLVNSQSLSLHRLYAASARWKADSTKRKVDIVAAEEAEKNLAEQEAKAKAAQP